MPDRLRLGVTPLKVSATGSFEIKLSGYRSARAKLSGADRTIKLSKRVPKADTGPRETYDPFEP